MSFGIQSVEKFFASAGKTIVGDAKKVAGVLAKIDTPSVKSAVELVTSALLPGTTGTIATQIEDAAFNALGKALKLATDTGNANGNATLLNLGFVQSEIDDLKALATSVKTIAPAHGVSAPTIAPATS
jgi:hypothetical protein